MPLISYACECGYQVNKFFRQAKEAPADFLCPQCNTKQAKKTLSAPSSVAKIVIDNGFMARALEVNPEIVEINQERSEKDYSQD